MTPRRPISTINLGGEGEVAGVVNQQRSVALAPGWGASLTGETLEQLALKGHDFLICPNTHLPINNDSVELFITNSVPIDVVLRGSQACSRARSSASLRLLASGFTTER